MIRPDYAAKGWQSRQYSVPGWGLVVLILAWWLLVIVCVDTSGAAS